MSHYAVLVIHEKDQSVDKLLAPYEEKPDNPNSKWDWYDAEGGRFQEDMMIDGKYVTTGKISDIEFLPDKYIYNEAVAAWRENRGNVRDKFLSEIDYVRFATEFYTFAVVTPDGEWHAPGNVLWFGMNDAPEEAMDYWRKYYREEFIDKYKKGYYCTLVDCHI